jgi:hypothetical protein
MDLALRRRLAGVADVRISQEQQTAEVVFTAGAHAFSPDEFRAAVKEADVDVVGFEIEACGRFESDGASHWFVAGSNRVAIGESSPTLAGASCLSAGLDDRVEPGRLEGIRLR